MLVNRMKSSLFDVRNMSTEILTLDNPKGWLTGDTLDGTSRRRAMKLSAVSACVEIVASSCAKLPTFIVNSNTYERVDHPLNDVLKLRPNEAMSRYTYEHLMTCNYLLRGNGYAAINRDRFAHPIELLPLPPDYVTPFYDADGVLWYGFTHPHTGERRRLSNQDVLNYPAYSEDGINGISVLRRAAETIGTAQMAQQYEYSFYRKGAQVPGVLSVDTSLDRESKQKLRDEWEQAYSGIDNAFRIAVLDLGLKYQPISVSNHDAQFVENKAVSVADISRFFGVPLYMLNEGKQSYSSNEQNSIEFVTRTLQPLITAREQEDTYKLLSDADIRKGLCVKRNMLALLRGDTTARSTWYKNMREIGVFSADDIRHLEDMPSVPGGDVRFASLNYVPLEDFQTLSQRRNSGGNS